MIEIMYTCNGCKQTKIKLKIEARRDDEGVIAFVERAAALVGQDHSIRSPWCHERHADILFPIGDDSIRYEIKDEKTE